MIWICAGHRVGILSIHGFNFTPGYAPPPPPPRSLSVTDAGRLGGGVFASIAAAAATQALQGGGDGCCCQPSILHRRCVEMRHMYLTHMG